MRKIYGDVKLSDLYFLLQMHWNKVSEKPQADSYFFLQSNMLAKNEVVNIIWSYL